MKTWPIVVVVLLALAAGTLWYAAQPSAPAAPAVTEETSDTTAPAVPEYVDEEAEIAVTGDEALEYAAGSDVGMEMPVPDDEAMLDPGATQTFTIDSFNYGYSMEEVRVREGDTVTITLTNSEGFHDWVVDEFDAATERINAGETATVTFVADRAGTYEFYCSVGNHRAQGMVGTLIVE